MACFTMGSKEEKEYQAKLIKEELSKHPYPKGYPLNYDSLLWTDGWTYNNRYIVYPLYTSKRYKHALTTWRKQMSTIQELIDDHKGDRSELKIRKRCWADEDYYTPYYLDQDNMWHGLDEDKLSLYYPGTEDDWELYTEPKPEPRLVKHWLWAHKTERLTTRYICSEEYIQKEFDNPEEWVKMLSTEIELEVK